jgi:hypothetical protein
MGHGWSDSGGLADPGPIHRATELQIQSCAAALHLLGHQAQQPRRLSQEQLLLRQNRSAGHQHQQQGPPRHGSRGRSGLAIGVMFWGITTGMRRSFRVCTLIVPSMANHWLVLV